MMRKVYLDHAATTPLDPEVLEAMLRSGAIHFGNPSSGHGYGRKARALMDEAAVQVVEAIGASRPEEILFTSGGTEADNLALRGVLASIPPERVLVVGATEHAAVLDTAADLEAKGRRVVRLPVDARARVDLDALAATLDRVSVGLVSLMWANNEVGSLQHMEAASRLCRARGVLLHSDAVQALGRAAVRVDRVPVDLLSGSAHKFNGPKGAGFLFVRRGTRLAPQLTGGLQQEGRRGGTENVLGIVGLGLALERAVRGMDGHVARLRRLAFSFKQALGEVSGMRILGDGCAEDQLPGHFSLCFEEVDGEALLLSLDLDGIAVSSGSACHTGSMEPSHVLLAMGLSPRQAKGTLRLVLGKAVDEEDLVYAASRLREHVERLRGTQ